MRTVLHLSAPLGAALCVLTFACSDASGQSTLFNTPSTDVVPKGSVYVEMDFVSHLADHAEGGFQTYAPRVVVGLGGRTEVGANVTFTDALAGDQPVEFQPNVKFKVYDGGDNGGAASIGGVLYTSVANGEGTDTFGLVYANASKKVSGRYGPRVTGGAYGLVGREDGLGSRGGAMLGFEQPLHRRVAFVADWFSGKNRFGYVTPGLGVALPKGQVFYAGYSVGNEGRRNNSLFIYYGVTF